MKSLGTILMLVFLCSPAFCGETEKKVFTATVGPEGVQRVSVSSGEYFFDPNYIIVKVNVPVELTISKTSGIVPHTFIMDAPDAGLSFSESISKDPKTIRFTPARTGKFPFYCSEKFLFFKSHREKGMEGVLEVVE